MSSDKSYDKMIQDSLFLDKWKEHMIETMQGIDPSFEKDEITDVLDDLLHQSLQVPEVNLDNNYTHENRDTNILSVADWAIKRKPIMAGNGTFYKNQEESINPVAKMLDQVLIDRKVLKNKMFTIKDPNDPKYKALDRGQGNKKMLNNSYYGGSGMPRSPFYSLYSGPATTHSAQEVISTAETLFEGLLVDNYTFIDANEVFHYMNTIRKEYKKEKEPIDGWVRQISKKELTERMVSMISEDIYTEEIEDMVYNYVSNLSKEERSYIYYKYNLFNFIKDHKEISDLYREIFSAIQNMEMAESIHDIPKDIYYELKGDTDKELISEYNTRVAEAYFMNPNKPPATIKDTLTIINNYLMKYVYTTFMSVDRIYRLKFFKRRTVCIIDTDSNILAVDSWVDFMREHILQGMNYGRDEEHNTFISVNCLAYFITSAISKHLDEFGKHSNIPAEYRKKYTMKNEFYFNRLVIGKKKKRYISSIKLREGNLIMPYKADVKGFDYGKATTSKEANERFTDIVRRRILESEKPDITGILKDLASFEKDIRDSIMSGETKYLPLANFKDMEAYADPYSQQGMRGGFAWNILYPDDQIEAPAKVSVLKLNIFSEDYISELEKTHPDIYIKIKNEIFGSSISKLSAKGIQILSIPSMRKIPEWCLPYIDINTVINNILGQFKGVLDVFGIACPEVGRTVNTVDRKTKRFSNVVRL